MGKIKEIFSRSPERMSRTVKWIFGLPIAFAFYFTISLFIPSFGNSGNGQLLRFAFLELILCFCVLYIAKAFLKQNLKLFLNENRKFNFVNFIKGLFVSVAVLSVMTFADMLIFKDNYSYIPRDHAFLLNWLCALILVVVAAAAEELIFRCYIAHFADDKMPESAKSLLIYSLVSGVLFMLFHFENPELSGNGAIWIMLFYFVFGFGLMIITFKTRGWEMSLGAHIGNNLIATFLCTYDNAVIKTNALFFEKDCFEPYLIVEVVVLITALLLTVGGKNEK